MTASARSDRYEAPETSELDTDHGPVEVAPGGASVGR